MKTNPVLRLLLYLLLAAESILFLLPLVWMLVTALKPIEQTMAVPPTWAPWRYTVEVGAATVPVKLGKALEDGRIEVVAEADGAVMTVPHAAVRRRFLCAQLAADSPAQVFPHHGVRIAILARPQAQQLVGDGTAKQHQRRIAVPKGADARGRQQRQE